MLKREVKFISDLNLNKLQVLGDRISVKDIQKSRIQPALIKYIIAAIEKELYLDKKRITENSIFDYEGDRIENYFKLIAEEIKLSQNFESQYIKHLLQQAIIFTTNYLTIPKHTLVNHIFDDEQKKSVQEIILGIEHAFYYKYLQKILFTYLDKKQIRSMTKEEFTALLNRIDTISRETHLEDMLTTAINSMSNFFEPNTKGEGRIPYGAISRFLDEKKLEEFSSRLIEKYGIDDEQLINSKELLNVLKSVTPETEMVIEEAEKVEEQLIAIENENENPVPPEEILENNEQQFENHSLLDIADEDEIPNHEIISENTEELLETDHQIITEDNNTEIPSKENKTEEIELEKKKIKTTEILKNVINLDSVFDKLDEVPTPFSDSTIIKHPTEIKTTLDGEIVYFLDDSDIAEKLEPLPEDNTSDNLEKENTTKVISDEKDAEDLPNCEDELQEVAEGEIVSDIDLIEPSEDNKELTEVFTDLEFLQNRDTESQNYDIDETDAESEAATEIENSEDSYSESNYNNDTDNISFSELVKQYDMTKIIEYIFDYDMEDYHSILNQISQVESEDDALKILLDYYKKNHLDLNAEEISQMTSIVSDYFTKTIS